MKAKTIGWIFGAAALSVLAAFAAPGGPQNRPRGATGGYGDTLYPYVHEYDQTLVYKIAVDYCPANKMPPLDAAKTLDVIRRIDT
jgi:hypothetical protein